MIRAAKSLMPALALLVAVAIFAPAVAAEDRQPNVLLLFADDQRADTIAALGNSRIQTPNLDRLVRRGVSFDRAYMQGSFNGATCVPSRAMLLTGQSLFRVDEKLLRDATWPEAFSKSGYSTFVSGKWHNGEQSLVRSFQQARGIFLGGMTNPLRAPLVDVVDGHVGPPAVAPKHACAVFADEAIEYLHETHERPFFCYVPFDAPHDPHVVPDDFPVKYDPAAIPVPENFLPQHPFDNGDMLIRDETLLDWPREPREIQVMNAEYYRYVSYLDFEIGRVLDALDASPHADNTIIVFAADTGVARGSHGLIGKQNCYEHSLRAPLVIAGPGIPEGQRTDALCYLFDVLPTLGKLCHVEAPISSEGIDLTDVLVNPRHAARSQLVFAYKDVQRAICDDDWKLIRYPQVDRTQLFHLRSDPQETNDLLQVPEHATRMREMLALLESELALYEDRTPLNVATPKSPNWTPPARSFR